MTALRMEFAKSRRRGLWLVCAALLAVEMAWMIWSFRQPSEQDIRLGWMLLFYNMPLLNGILFPIIGATLASRVADVEHKGNTLKLLEAIQPKTQLFHAKLLLGMLYIASLTALQAAAMIAMGLHFGFAGDPPMMDMAQYALFVFTTCFAVYLLQLSLSLTIRNQMVPLCVGLGGSFLGLLLMFIPQMPWVRRLCGPFGYFGVLMFVWMADWDKDTRVMELIRVPSDWASFTMLLGWIVIIYIVGRAVFVRKEL